MSQQDDQPAETQDKPADERVANPFAVGDEAEGERPQINLSPRRAAVLGLTFGAVMVGLLLICFLGSAALASCTGV